MYKCHISRWLVTNSKKMAIVEIPAAVSPIIISCLRLQRSTNGPAKEAAMTLGVWVKKTINTKSGLFTPFIV